MPANRTAVFTAALTAAVTGLVALLGALHSDTAKAIVIATALVVVGAVTIVFLIGWQKYEARQDAKPKAARGKPATPAETRL